MNRNAIILVFASIFVISITIYLTCFCEHISIIQNEDTVRTSWKNIGDRNPYKGVLTGFESKEVKNDPETKKAFFESGEKDINLKFNQLNKKGIKFPFGRALDIGSGVGRLTIPLSRRFKKVVGLDISDSMIKEAKKASNIDYKLFKNTLSGMGKFDFVYSMITFQHNPESEQYKMLKEIPRILTSNGVAVLHLVYSSPTQPKAFDPNAFNMNAISKKRINSAVTEGGGKVTHFWPENHTGGRFEDGVFIIRKK